MTRTTKIVLTAITCICILGFSLFFLINIGLRNGDTPMRITGNIPVDMGPYLTIHFEFEMSHSKEGDNIFEIHNIDTNAATIDFSEVFAISKTIPYDYDGILPDIYNPLVDDSGAFIHHVEDGVVIYLHRYVMFHESYEVHGHVHYARISFFISENRELLVETARWHPQWVEATVTSFLYLAIR